MAKAVIFDVDGTLVDSVDLHAKAWQEAFGDYDHVIEFDKIREQIGKGSDQLLPVFLDKDEVDKIGKPLDKHRAKLLKARYFSQIKAFPKVRALFERLLADGKKIALASSAPAADLKAYKELAHIDDLVRAETSSDDVEKSKPHPDIFEAAIKRLGSISRSDILVVGDTPYDAEAAGKAGLKTVGLLCGGFSEESLRRAGCIAIYGSPADLLANYDRSPIAGKQLA